MQYPAKDLYGEEMDWQEFSVLLGGIMPETPLGQIVSIRSEEDPTIIKGFNSSQKSIRDTWRVKQLEKMNKFMSQKEKEIKVEELQNIFAKAFG